MKQSDRHKHGKVIRVSGNILRELDKRRGELSYDEAIEKLLMATTPSGLQRLLKLIRR